MYRGPVTALTDDRAPDRENARPGEVMHPYVGSAFMNMSQLIIGSALGCLLAQAVLYSGRSLLKHMQPPHASRLLRAVAPGPRIVSMFVRYAAPVAVAAALVTLGVWTLEDYLAAKSSRNAAVAATFDPAAASAAQPRNAADDSAGHAAAPEAASADAGGSSDPYSDPDFKVQHRQHHAGAATLKDTLLQRSEAKASADLRREIQQHLQRSQYDCEAAEHADRYLKAGLDVWGFAAWQQRYFPVSSYKGATLEQCKDIKTLVPGSLDLQSTVAQGTSR